MQGARACVPAATGARLPPVPRVSRCLHAKSFFTFFFSTLNCLTGSSFISNPMLTREYEYLTLWPKKTVFMVAFSFRKEVEVSDADRTGAVRAGGGKAPTEAYAGAHYWSHLLPGANM